MSQSTSSGGSNQLHVQTDISQIFLGGNESNENSYINNSTYDPITLPAGTIIGRISSTDVCIPWRSDVNDGSQYPIGLLMVDMEVDSGATVKIPICTAGRVAAEKIVANQLSNQSVSTTLELQVSNAGGRRIKDLLEEIGLHLIYTTENSRYDN